MSFAEKKSYSNGLSTGLGLKKSLTDSRIRKKPVFYFWNSLDFIGGEGGECPCSEEPQNLLI